MVTRARPSRSRGTGSRRKPRAGARGKHGGQRAGAGRKQEKLPEQLLEELGAPPTDDPLKKSRWWARLLEVLQLGVLKGRPWVTMMRDARANALAASKLIPEEIKAKAAALLAQDERELAEDQRVTEVDRKEDAVARNARAVRRDPPRA